jgi:hypothetical protein
VVHVRLEDRSRAAGYVIFTSSSVLVYFIIFFNAKQ